LVIIQLSENSSVILEHFVKVKKMRPQEIIARKRDSRILTRAEINSFVSGVTNGTWADYQTSALIMAMFINGLSLDEQNALTDAMLNSGEQLDFPEIEKPKADKHSTGGVGDKTSLIIAPLVAACGVAVPMISGRGLGHTGGTLDKLEAIKDYNVNLSTEELRRTIEKCGFAMAGQTASLVPADRKLYALRDATATVESIPLIVASIMSKKLAENLDALVLDVKTGSGAFMRELEDSKRLAEALVKTGNAFGVRTEAVISDMNQPLGKYVGNALEVYECIEILKGDINVESQPTWELSLELSARILVLSGIAENVETARQLASSKLWSGEALEKFQQNIQLQGGNPEVCEKPEQLWANNLYEVEIKSFQSGFITEIDATGVGQAISEIGGGRTRTDDLIDHAVGYACQKKIGDAVRENETIGVLFSRNEVQADLIYEKLANAYRIEDEKPIGKFELIKEIIN
jgi:pyrimidine-nucleoside phosphorylase